MIKIKIATKYFLNKLGFYNLETSKKYRYVKELYEETRAMIEIQPLVNEVLQYNNDILNNAFPQQASLNQEEKPILFQYWHQGINDIPDIVRNCYASIDYFLSKDFDIIRIDYKTLSNYITLPEFIIKAREEERMTIAHFSDIIRNKLLLEFGGLWLDSSVLITGKKDVLEFISLDNRLMLVGLYFLIPRSMLFSLRVGSCG